MNATVRDLGRKGGCRRARVHGHIGLALTKEDHQGESGEGKREAIWLRQSGNLTKATSSATELRFVTRARLSFCCAWSLVGAG